MTTIPSPSRIELAGVDDVSAAREVVMDMAWAAGLDAPGATDAAVVASELVTNALTHGKLPACLTVQVLRPGVLMVQVADSGGPVVIPSGDDSWPEVSFERGRGLLLCVALCSSVTARPLTGGKVVVATFTAEP